MLTSQMAFKWQTVVITCTFICPTKYIYIYFENVFQAITILTKVAPGPVVVTVSRADVVVMKGDGPVTAPPPSVTSSTVEEHKTTGEQIEWVELVGGWVES